jgi:hypothetical protein
MGNFYTDVIRVDDRFNSTSRVADPNLLEPTTRALVEAIIANAAANGMKLMIFETYRSQARQAALFQQGATKLWQVGVHHYGLACDLVKDINGQPSWKGDFSLLGQLAHHQKMIWGGDWGTPGTQHTFIDDDHVQRCTVGRQGALFAGTWYPSADYDPYVDLEGGTVTARLAASSSAEIVALAASKDDELRRDMAEATKYLHSILDAAEKCSVEPALICAIGSRESNWGQGSDMKPKGPAGTGDWAPRNPARWGYAMPPDGLGWGRGLMQVDYAQSDFGKTGNWRDPAANILFGTEELAGNIAFYKAHPSPNVDPIRAATAAYNCGRGNVGRAINNGVDVDSYTTGHDYSRDVLRRYAWFKANGFGEHAPAALVA